MKKVKRILCLVISVLMLVTILASCGQTKTTTSASPAASGTPAASSSAKPAASPAASAAASASAAPSAAASQAPPPADAKFAEHLNIIIDNNRISVVNPLEPASNATSTYWVMTMIYDRLINYDEGTSSFKPALATKWETTDYKTFNFDLRNDVKFHNGESFTANDVIYTINKAKDAKGTMMAAYWSSVVTATAISDYKLKLELNAVNVDFLMAIAQPMMGILNKKAIDADAVKGVYVGTGPFKYTDFKSNEYCTVTRNDNYWGTKAYTKSMTLRYIPEVASRATMMQNNEAQISFGTGVEDYKLFKNDKFQILPLTMNNAQGISFNMLNPVTADINFRMAVAYAMDRDEISTVCSGEWGKFLTDGSIWGYATEFRNTSVPVITRDLKKAKEYLAKSNYKGQEVEIAASIMTNVKASEVLQSQLAEIGIKSKINATDSAGMNALFFKPEHYIIFHGITFTYAAGSAKNVFAPGGAQNRGSYNNQQVTDLLTKAATTTDAKARADIYKQIQEIESKDLAYINVFWRMNGIVAAKGVGGLVLPSDTVQTDLRGAYLILK